MKIDKGCVNLMLRSLRPGYINSAAHNQTAVLSLWSGTELDSTAVTSLKTTFTLADGRIQSHWPTTLQTGRGSIELARLVCANFADRYEEKDGFDFVLDLAKRTELFNPLAVGTAQSFTLSLVNTSWSAYTNAAANDGRLIISGSAGVYGSGADLELQSTAITSASRIKANRVVLRVNIPAYDNSWSI